MKKENKKKSTSYRAYIWEPENEKLKSPCTILIKSGDPIKIECWEELKIFNNLYDDLNFHSPISYLIGTLEDGSNFSVYNIKIENIRIGTGISKILLFAEQFLDGHHLKFDEKAVHYFNVRSQYLPNWAGLNPVSIEKSIENDLEYNALLKLPKSLLLGKTQNFRLYLDHSISYPLQNVSSLEINPIPNLTVIFNSISSIQQVIKSREGVKLFFQLLLNINSGIIETKIFTNNHYKLCDFRSFENKLQWNYNNVSKRNILIDLETFINYSNSFIPKWFSIFNENSDAITEYYRISNSRNLSNKREIFMNSVQGLEMFYKIFYKDETGNSESNYNKEDKLKKKITTFLDELNDISDEIIPNRKNFINKIIGTRNHFAHYNLFSREGDKNIISNNFLGAYSRRVEIINDFVLLYNLGTPKEILVERFKKHVHYFIYKDQNYIFSQT